MAELPRVTPAEMRNLAERIDALGTSNPALQALAGKFSQATDDMSDAEVLKLGVQGAQAYNAVTDNGDASRSARRRRGGRRGGRRPQQG